MYRAAVIGLGRMGSTFDDEISLGGAIYLPYAHAPSYVASPLVELVTGADPHPEQREIFGQRWGLAPEQLYADYREMVAREQPDIVSVCTSARIRSTIVQELAQAGVKAIWAEKPIALSLAEADAMVEACQAHGTALAINCGRRWAPSLITARQLIQAGELGDILQVNGFGQCGLSHNGSHLIDTVRYLAGGEVQWVFGEVESDEAAAGENDLMGNGYLAFANGVRAFIRGMPNGPANWEFDVIGTTGRIRSTVNAQETELYQMVVGGQRGRGQPARVPFPTAARQQSNGLAVVEDLVQAIETGQPPRCSGVDGRAALEVAVALRESHRRGGARVDLPILDRSQTIYSAEIAHDAVPARIRRLQG